MIDMPKPDNRKKRFNSLRIFSQNVNRNYSLTETLLQTRGENYDLLFIQEPPWKQIRKTVSTVSKTGDDVIGPPIHPNWTLLAQHSGMDSPPRVLIYAHTQLACFRPSLQRDLIDDCDISILSLSCYGSVLLLANVYSDEDGRAIDLLSGLSPTFPSLFFMCGDFNSPDNAWDPSVSSSSLHLQLLLEFVDSSGLGLCSLVQPGPTRFLFNPNDRASVLDLMFIPDHLIADVRCHILPEERIPSDHAPMTATMPLQQSGYIIEKSIIPKGGEEEDSFIAQVGEGLLGLTWPEHI